MLTATPETSRKIVWSAPLHPQGSVLEYRLGATTAWTTVRAAPESSQGCEAVWSATLSGLAPGSFYEYRVSGASAQGPVLGETHALRTGALSGFRRFRFAFFGGNGLAASPHSPRAATVLSQIDYLAPPLVLGAGGYALSGEAIAAGVVPDTATALEEWKHQAGEVTANSIFAPVLGGREVEGLSHGERASDYAEFTRSATGTASPGGSRSFDFNGTHFVALHVPGLGSIHPATTTGAANLAWLDADLAAARRAGARWIVVYMHADVFSSEKTDAGTSGVRKGLGDVLQRHGVNLVLSAEGSSYERSLALRGPLDAPIIGPKAWRVTTTTDGIVFVRAGSGGRTTFGRWVPTKPAWTAFRENARAVFLGVTADANALRVIAYGVDARGMRTVVDTLEIR